MFSIIIIKRESISVVGMFVWCHLNCKKSCILQPEIDLIYNKYHIILISSLIKFFKKWDGTLANLKSMTVLEAMFNIKQNEFHTA